MTLKDPYNPVIDLLSLSDSDDDKDDNETDDECTKKAASATVLVNVNDETNSRACTIHNKRTTTSTTSTSTANASCCKRMKFIPKLQKPSSSSRRLQAGLVLENDDDTNQEYGDNHGSDPNSSTMISSWLKVYTTTREQQQQQQEGHGGHLLYHDQDFGTIPESIHGPHYSKQKTVTCRCQPPQPVALEYSTRSHTVGKPFFHCAQGKCNYFQWAFQSERMHWYRFGRHTGHVIVRQEEGFSANDLVQGKVGDCWFLSALAVIAERPDLIWKLFGNGTHIHQEENDDNGIVQVTLFVDGFWRNVVMDNFLPCIIHEETFESDLQQAIQESLDTNGCSSTTGTTGSATGLSLRSSAETAVGGSASSNHDPFALSDQNLKVLCNINEFLEQHRHFQNKGLVQQQQQQRSTTASIGSYPYVVPTSRLNRMVTSDDLAYSKAKKNQLWVPFLEKAYAKCHGCYQAISGGHIAEAFLDLTGAPTLSYHFDSPDFFPRQFWSQLVSYRHQQLPMGCATSHSQVGLVGRHAYSILDIQEVRNVCVDFFKDKLLTGTLGNVSGFTEFDGTVRLLRIRNPHGKGEWKGEFSDNSGVWERLVESQAQQSAAFAGGKLVSPSLLERTMTNDGTFWIDYDSFLMGFTNVDVVLAFLDSHAKSFNSYFPPKKSNARCTRAFEVSLLDVQPGVPSRDTVELYVMGIQKTRRGAYHGRSDRKKSYKVCDLGMLIGENRENMGKRASTEEQAEFDTVEGQMFGFTRNGHHRLILDRKKNKRLVVMPISFGHPTATDKELHFVLRFVSDAPLLIRELPKTPRMDIVMQKFCLESGRGQNSILGYPTNRHGQGTKRILLDGAPLFRIFQIDCLANGGGTVFIYLSVNDDLHDEQKGSDDLSFSIEASCRGMMCRTADGLLNHETVSKGRKFEAAWRRYNADFHGESRSRLLMVLFQSGQDTELGSVTCKRGCRAKEDTFEESNSLLKFYPKPQSLHSSSRKRKPKHDNYDNFGVFNGTDNLRGTDDFVDAFHHSAIGNQVVSLDDNPEQNFDLELERALALSRGDTSVELNRTIDAIRKPGIPPRQNVDSEEGQLQQALEMSVWDAGCMRGLDNDIDRAVIASWTRGIEQKSFSQELEEAIQSSLRDKLPSNSTTVSKPEIIDLEDENAAPSENKSASSKNREETIKGLRGETGDERTGTGGDDVETKRRLASEAAMKRFESHTE